MSLSEKISPLLPFLRRYGRALTGSHHSGDAYVKAALEALVADPSLLSGEGDLRVQLYHLFHGVWSSADLEIPDDPKDTRSIEDVASSRLAKIPTVQRQAVLLKTLEGFEMKDIAKIMSVDEAHLETLVATGLAELVEQTQTHVLIIEDEPLIAMDLEQIVETMGHAVSAIATTRDEAVDAANDKRPGLVLADIQLADGSSGIEAVKDILGSFNVPVIFITAFPERLLTGERPEPTFLITKPFLASAVQVAISQALFFWEPS